MESLNWKIQSGKDLFIKFTFFILRFAFFTNRVAEWCLR